MLTIYEKYFQRLKINQAIDLIKIFLRLRARKIRKNGLFGYYLKASIETDHS